MKYIEPELLTSDNPFATEINFSRVHAASKGLHQAIREAKCVAQQFPSSLCPIMEGDLFSGRFYISSHLGLPDKVKYRGGYRISDFKTPAIGWTSLRAGSGSCVGYFYDENMLDKKIKEINPDSETLSELEMWKEYWAKNEPVHLLRESYPEHIDSAIPSDDWVAGNSTYPAYPLYRMTGPHMNFDLLVKEGIPGIFKMINEKQSSAEAGSETRDYCEGWKESVNIVVESAKFYEKQAREMSKECSDISRKRELNLIADTNKAITERTPQNLREAIQLVWLWSLCSTAYSFGRADVYLGDLLASDLDNGILTKDDALKLICSFWQLIADCGAPYDNRVIIGGCGRRNPENADRFAELALEATGRVKEPLPQLSLRFDAGNPGKLYERALDLLGEGRTFPMLYNDSVNVPAVQNAFNVPLELAEQYTPYGCGEYVLHHHSFGTPSGVVNLTKVLELTLFKGRDQYGKCHCEPLEDQTGEFESFNELWNAFESNVRFFSDTLAWQQKKEYEWAAEINGYNLFSLLYNDCINRGRGIFAGGIKHLGGTIESYGQINAGDSLYAIKRLVFDDKRIPLERLKSALANNFENDVELLKIINTLPHYGNDIDEVDRMVAKVHEMMCKASSESGTKAGLDSYLTVIINNSANTVLGAQTAASADGRRAGKPLANGNNPTPGRDVNGVTAFLNSLLKLNPAIHAGAVQNMKFSKSFFTAKRNKLSALLNTYFSNGGAQAMITTINPDDLRNAMEEPEKWENLIVRVGGFSSRFVYLSKAIQMEVLERTLYE